MMLGSTGSGTAKPLSPPPTECHIPLGIPPRLRRAVAGTPVRGAVLHVPVDVVGGSGCPRPHGTSGPREARPGASSGSG